MDGGGKRRRLDVLIKQKNMIQEKIVKKLKPFTEAVFSERH
jgi:hypothetical protein